MKENHQYYIKTPYLVDKVNPADVFSQAFTPLLNMLKKLYIKD